MLLRNQVGSLVGVAAREGPGDVVEKDERKPLGPVVDQPELVG